MATLHAIVYFLLGIVFGFPIILVLGFALGPLWTAILPQAWLSGPVNDFLDYVIVVTLFAALANSVFFTRRYIQKSGK